MHTPKVKDAATKLIEVEKYVKFKIEQLPKKGEQASILRGILSVINSI